MKNQEEEIRGSQNGTSSQSFKTNGPIWAWKTFLKDHGKGPGNSLNFEILKGYKP